MGGIKLEHLAQLKALKAEHIAAVTAFTAAPSPKAAAEEWIRLLQ
jgi:thiamine monophosphate synthase